MTQQLIDEDVVPLKDINVAIVPLPGAVKGNGYQCPNCSLVHIDWDVVDDEKVTVPDDCLRCGCPMDRDLQRDFAEEHASETPENRLESTAVAEANAILFKAQEAQRAAESALEAIKETQAAAKKK